MKFFEKATKRERIMAAAVGACFLLLWGTYLSGLSARTRAEGEETEKRTAAANAAIANEPAVNAKLARLEKTFDPAKTLSATSLQIAAEKAAKAANMDFSMSQTKSTGGKIHTITLTIPKTELKNCADFENRLRELEPYAAITKASFVSAGGGGISAVYEISAFSLAKKQNTAQNRKHGF